MFHGLTTAKLASNYIEFNPVQAFHTESKCFLPFPASAPVKVLPAGRQASPVQPLPGEETSVQSEGLSGHVSGSIGSQEDDGSFQFFQPAHAAHGDSG